MVLLSFPILGGVSPLSIPILFVGGGINLFLHILTNGSIGNLTWLYSSVVLVPVVCFFGFCLKKAKSTNYSNLISFETIGLVGSLSVWILQTILIGRY
jgi:hypothetical protein